MPKDRNLTFRESNRRRYQANPEMHRQLFRERYKVWQRDAYRKCKNFNVPWSDEEDAFLKENHDTLSDYRLALAIGRPYGGVRARRKRLKLFKLGEKKSKKKNV